MPDEESLLRRGEVEVSIVFAAADQARAAAAEGGPTVLFEDAASPSPLPPLGLTLVLVDGPLGPMGAPDVIISYLKQTKGRASGNAPLARDLGVRVGDRLVAVVSPGLKGQLALLAALRYRPGATGAMLTSTLGGLSRPLTLTLARRAASGTGNGAPGSGAGRVSNGASRSRGRSSSLGKSKSTTRSPEAEAAAVAPSPRQVPTYLRSASANSSAGGSSASRGRGRSPVASPSSASRGRSSSTNVTGSASRGRSSSSGGSGGARSVPSSNSRGRGANNSSVGGGAGGASSLSRSRGRSERGSPGAARSGGGSGRSGRKPPPVVARGSRAAAMSSALAAAARAEAAAFQQSGKPSTPRAQTAAAAMSDFTLNARRHMASELADARAAFAARAAASGDGASGLVTVAEGPSFRHTEAQAALRGPKQDPSSPPRAQTTEAMRDFNLNLRRNMASELVGAREAFAARASASGAGGVMGLVTVAEGPKFKHTEAQAALRGPPKAATDSYSISAQDCEVYQRNIRVETSRELQSSREEWDLRDTTSPTQAIAFNFDVTSRHRAVRLSIKAEATASGGDDDDGSGWGPVDPSTPRIRARSATSMERFSLDDENVDDAHLISALPGYAGVASSGRTQAEAEGQWNLKLRATTSAALSDAKDEWAARQAKLAAAQANGISVSSPRSPSLERRSISAVKPPSDRFVEQGRASEHALVTGRARMSAALCGAREAWEQRIHRDNGGMRVTVPIASRMERRSFDKLDTQAPAERFVEQGRASEHALVTGRAQMGAALSEAADEWHRRAGERGASNATSPRGPLNMERRALLSALAASPPPVSPSPPASPVSPSSPSSPRLLLGPGDDLDRDSRGTRSCDQSQPRAALLEALGSPRGSPSSHLTLSSPSPSPPASPRGRHASRPRHGSRSPPLLALAENGSVGRGSPIALVWDSAVGRWVGPGGSGPRTKELVAAANAGKWVEPRVVVEKAIAAGRGAMSDELAAAREAWTSSTTVARAPAVAERLRPQPERFVEQGRAEALALVQGRAAMGRALSEARGEWESRAGLAEAGLLGGPGRHSPGSAVRRVGCFQSMLRPQTRAPCALARPHLPFFFSSVRPLCPSTGAQRRGRG